MAVRRIASDSPYEPRVGYCRAVVVDGGVFVSGTTGQDHGTGHVPDAVSDQCRLALDHIDAALAAAGASFSDVVRVRYILPDHADLQTCWPVLRDAFGAAPPAATMIVAGPIDPMMRIEIEAVARISDAGRSLPF